ncbi:MAG TPA: hypothetical protein VGB31_08500, partial [Myxococcota bacterium]
MTKVSRPAAFGLAPLAVGLAAVALGSCAERPANDALPGSVEEIEQIFQQTRALEDQIEVTRSRGATVATDGVALTELI